MQHKQKFDEARDLAEYLINQDKYDYSAYWQLAELNRYEGNIIEAERLYQKSKAIAKEYYDKFCENPYDFNDYDGKCGNRYHFLNNFDKNKNKPVNF